MKESNAVRRGGSGTALAVINQSWLERILFTSRDWASQLAATYSQVQLPGLRDELQGEQYCGWSGGFPNRPYQPLVGMRENGSNTRPIRRGQTWPGLHRPDLSGE